MPQRIQRKQTAGWRIPPGTVYVARPSKWGNPFTTKQAHAAGYHDLQHAVVWAFERWLAGDPDFVTIDNAPARIRMRNEISELRGKDLCCWCRPDQKCHADVLLHMANK